MLFVVIYDFPNESWNGNMYPVSMGLVRIGLEMGWCWECDVSSQYHGCWWPGSVHCQVISSHGIDLWHCQYWPILYQFWSIKICCLNSVAEASIFWQLFLSFIIFFFFFLRTSDEHTVCTITPSLTNPSKSSFMLSIKQWYGSNIRLQNTNVIYNLQQYQNKANVILKVWFSFLRPYAPE